MTELESLFLVLGVVYLALCTVWVRRETFVLRALVGREMRCAPANALVGGEEGALQWLNPLPPFGLVYVVQPLPVSLAAEGALGWIGASHPSGPRAVQPDPRFVPWSEVRSVEARDRHVLVNGVRFVRADSARLAAHVAELLGGLARAEPAARERRIEKELERHVDTVALGDAAGRAERLTRGLVPLQTALFLLVFAGVPALALADELRRQWPWAVLALLVLQTLLVARLWRAAGALVRAERWKIVLQCALSPIAAMRARDFLTRDALAPYAPLAAA